jgi:hypothetical protein
VWIETVLLVEAAMGLCLSALNVGLLMPEVRHARSRARSVAALALAGVCAGQALEALLFLVLDGPSSAGGAWAGVALVCVRSLLSGSSMLISILLVRAAARR